MIAAVDFAGIAQVVVALAALIGATGGLLIGLRNTRQITATHEVAVAIDNAVNNRDGGTTVSQDVAKLAARLPAQDKAAEVITDAARVQERATNGGGVSLRTPEGGS